jgi:hypothetical protein
MRGSRQRMTIVKPGNEPNVREHFTRGPWRKAMSARASIMLAVMLGASGMRLGSEDLIFRLDRVEATICKPIESALRSK